MKPCCTYSSDEYAKEKLCAPKGLQSFLYSLYFLKKATAIAPGPAWVPMTLPMDA